MKLIYPFSQREVILRLPDNISLPTKGVCFRLTFKWAGCTLAGGVFKAGNQVNAVKTATKHSGYRKDTLALEKHYGGDLINHMDQYTLTDWKASLSHVSEWAKEFTDANKKKMSVRVIDQSAGSIREYLEQFPNLGKAAIMAGFYGKRGNGTIMGHVVGYCSTGAPITDGPCFFDSNCGLFEFLNNEVPGVAIMKHIKDTYFSNNGDLLTHFNTLVLKV